jgi:hypothetical protein
MNTNACFVAVLLCCEKNPEHTQNVLAREAERERMREREECESEALFPKEEQTDPS